MCFFYIKICFLFITLFSFVTWAVVLQNLASVHSVNMAKVSSQFPGAPEPTLNKKQFSFLIFNLAQSEVIIRGRIEARDSRVDFNAILEQ